MFLKKILHERKAQLDFRRQPPLWSQNCAHYNRDVTIIPEIPTQPWRTQSYRSNPIGSPGSKGCLSICLVLWLFAVYGWMVIMWTMCAAQFIKHWWVFKGRSDAGCTGGGRVRWRQVAGSCSETCWSFLRATDGCSAWLSRGQFSCKNFWIFMSGMLCCNWTVSQSSVHAVLYMISRCRIRSCQLQ